MKIEYGWKQIKVQQELVTELQNYKEQQQSSGEWLRTFSVVLQIFLSGNKSKGIGSLHRCCEFCLVWAGTAPFQTKSHLSSFFFYTLHGSLLAGLCIPQPCPHVCDNDTCETWLQTTQMPSNRIEKQTLIYLNIWMHKIQPNISGS